MGPETGDKPEGSQPICEGRALQDGGPSFAPGSPAVTGLDGKSGLEGCLPSSAHPLRLSIPHVHTSLDDTLTISFNS